jgi:Skp family chaperone for outer membrane proteins
MPDPLNIIDTLENATEISKQVVSKMDTLEKSVVNMAHKMQTMNDRVGTMNAHLENIERESAMTTHILSEESDARKDREKHERDIELKALEHTSELEKGSLEMKKKIYTEVWDIIKKPLGYLIAAIVGYIVYKFFPIG